MLCFAAPLLEVFRKEFPKEWAAVSSKDGQTIQAWSFFLRKVGRAGVVLGLDLFGGPDSFVLVSNIFLEWLWLVLCCFCFCQLFVLFFHLAVLWRVGRCMWCLAMFSACLPPFCVFSWLYRFIRCLFRIQLIF